MISLNIPKSELNKFEREIKRYAKQNHSKLELEIADATLTAERLAKKKAPAKEGDLRQKIRSEIQKGTLTGTVISGADHSAPVEFGSKPHVIRAWNKKVLANVNTGQFFGKKVNHPGTSPQPFLEPAVRYGYKKLIDNIKKLFR